MKADINSGIYNRILLFPEHASLRQIIEYVEEKLEWNPIRLVPTSPINNWKKTWEGSRLITIDRVVSPILTNTSFMAYAEEINYYLDNQLKKLVKDKSLTKEEKVRILSICKRKSIESQLRYKCNNIFKFAIGITWQVQEKSGKFREIIFSKLSIPKSVLNVIADEFNTRQSYFEWISLILDTYIVQVENLEYHDPLVLWKKGSPNNCIGEIMYALSVSGYLEFTSKSCKKLFRKQMEKLFALKNPNWSDIEADIRKRTDKNRAKFLEELANAIK